MRFSFANMSWLSQGATQAHTAAGREREANALADAALSRTSAPRQAGPAREPTANRLDLASQPLAPTTRADMEGRFGCDFSQVRVSADTRADRTASGLNARAFAYGNQLVFAQSEFAPHTSSGRRLLAHELAHVTQQRQSGRAEIQRDGKPGPTLEEEASQLQFDLGAAATPAARKPVVTRALEFCGRGVAALAAAKTSNKSDDIEKCREALKKVARALAANGEPDAAAQFAIKSNEPDVYGAVIANMSRGKGVSGQQAFLRQLAPLGGQTLTAEDATHSQQWLKSNTSKIGKTFAELDKKGVKGLKRDMSLELSEDLLTQYYAESPDDEKPDILGDPTAKTLKTDQSTHQIKADCDVYATYAARLLREQGWTTALYMTIIPNEAKPGETKIRDGHAVALARKQVDPKDASKGYKFLGVSNTTISEFGSKTDNDKALPDLKALALTVYDPPLQNYDVYVADAGPNGEFEPKLLDPKNNKLVPKESVRPKPTTGATP
ncbi:eCIS core domain-containing protein [Bradyrhizobium sp. 930_D9_N1_4]|uniref:eCIS core domain-containing protein n=1 Tax=Bradyrhizobium sp. 930_D9_N1_4 TaxID=3240374 RepID=UPI003F893029